MKSKKIEAKVENIYDALKWITSEIQQYFNHLDCLKIELCCEEILSNIIFYAYNDDAKHCYIEIFIFINKNKQQLEITMKDKGKKFNPIIVKRVIVDVKDKIEDIKKGKLGIFFVKKIMNKIVYTRKNNENILKIIKKFY